MKKTGKRIGILLVAVFVVFLVSIPLVNDYTVLKLKRKLKEIPLPKNTEYVEAMSKAGKLTGNGNGMQYLAAILIKSELSLEEVSAYYSNQTEACTVEEQFGENVVFVEHEDLSFHTQISGSGYYVVSIWGDGIEPFASIDIRGH